MLIVIVTRNYTKDLITQYFCNITCIYFAADKLVLLLLLPCVLCLFRRTIPAWCACWGGDGLQCAVIFIKY